MPAHPMVRRIPPLAGLALAVIACAGCGSSSSANGGVTVVATTTQLGDFVRQVGGNAVDVHQILQPNTDPHEYEPRPDDVTKTTSAKVVFLSGNNLDRWMGKVLGEAGGDPRVVTLADSNVDRVAGETSGPEASRYDPHWWHDPRNVEAAIPVIRDALTKADPKHGAQFSRNAAAYEAKLKTLDRGIARCLNSVPAAQRNLVTSHDAFNYFAKRYAIHIIGAVIPSQTTEAQPSAGALSRLSAQVKAHHVKAIFPESSINPKLAQALAKQTGARSNLVLYGDTLGPHGSPGATYLGMERSNASAMLEGFTGTTRGCAISGL